MPLQTTDMVFQHLRVSAELPTPVVLDGSLHVSPAGGLLGSVVFAYGSGGTATLSAGADGTLTLAIGDQTFDVDPSDQNSVNVNGTTRTVASTLDAFATDARSGLDPTGWSLSGQATVVIAALVSTDAWAANTRAILAGEGTHAAVRSPFARAVGPRSSVSPGWCKVTAYGAEALVTAAATGGCLALQAACQAANGFTFGGLTIPCISVGSLCAGGVYAGGNLAYELALSFWSPTPTTTTSTSTTSTTLMPGAALYTYQGKPFTSFYGSATCADGVGVCMLSGSFSLATALPANLRDPNGVPVDCDLTDLSFTDGVRTITKADLPPCGTFYPFLRVYQTDAKGQITGWHFVILSNGGEFETLYSVPFFGSAYDFTAIPTTDGEVIQAGNASDPGTWTIRRSGDT